MAFTAAATNSAALANAPPLTPAPISLSLPLPAPLPYPGCCCARSSEPLALVSGIKHRRLPASSLPSCGSPGPQLPSSGIPLGFAGAPAPLGTFPCCVTLQVPGWLDTGHDLSKDIDGSPTFTAVTSGPTSNRQGRSHCHFKKLIQFNI